LSEPSKKHHSLNNPKRYPDEDFENYKTRRAAWNKLVKLYLRGRPVYSHPMPQQVEHEGNKVWIQPPRVPYVKEGSNEQPAQTD